MQSLQATPPAEEAIEKPEDAVIEPGEENQRPDDGDVDERDAPPVLQVPPETEMENQSKETAIIADTPKEQDPQDLLGGLRVLVDQVQQVTPPPCCQD